MGNINELDNLLNQKDEIKKQINNAELEIKMGEITKDDEMITNAQKRKEELKKQTAEIEEKIVKEQAKVAKKRELEVKYPKQQIFHVIELMSDEEIKEYAEKEATPNRERKAKLEEEKENLKNQKEELVKKIDSIKAEFMKTHNEKLLTDAENIVEKFKETNQAIEKNAAELEKVGPTEFNLTEFRNGMIDALKGYAKPASTDVINYFQDKLEAGMSVEDITKELNDYAASQKNNKYSEDAYKFANIVGIVSPVGDLLSTLAIPQNKSVYESTLEELNRITKELEEAPYDMRINNTKDQVLNSLEETINSCGWVLELCESNEAENNEPVVQVEKDSKNKINHTKNIIDKFRTELAFRIIDEGFVPNHDMPSEGSVIRAIEDYDEEYSRENSTIEHIEILRKAKQQQMEPIYKFLNEVYKKLVEEKRDVKQQVIDAVTENVNDGDGEIQPEDIENYLILQEFIAEQREIVKSKKENSIVAIPETKENQELQEMLNEVSPEEKTEEKAVNKIN